MDILYVTEFCHMYLRVRVFVCGSQYCDIACVVFNKWNLKDCIFFPWVRFECSMYDMYIYFDNHGYLNRPNKNFSRPQYLMLANKLFSPILIIHEPYRFLKASTQTMLTPYGNVVYEIQITLIMCCLSTSKRFLTPVWVILIRLSLQLYKACIYFLTLQIFDIITDLLSYGPLTRYVKLLVAHAPGMPGTFSPQPTSKETASQRSRHASRHVRHTRAVMHVRIANPQWRGKRSRHSRRMRNPQFYVSGKRPIGQTNLHWLCESKQNLIWIAFRFYVKEDFGSFIRKIMSKEGRTIDHRP